MSDFLRSAGLTAFQLAFQASPIILSGGIAASIPGGLMPIIMLTEGLGLLNGVLSGSVPSSLDDLVAQFIPATGSTLIDQELPEYPLANVQVASNATVQNPLRVSMLMIAPVRDAGGYVSKIATFSALKSALSLHNQQGGSYTVMTPAYPYTNMLMRVMQDATPPDSIQKQIVYQIDFEAPLITQAQATAAQNNLMSQFSNGSQINGQPATSGPIAAAGGPALGTATTIPGTNIASAAYGGTAGPGALPSGAGPV